MTAVTEIYLGPMDDEATDLLWRPWVHSDGNPFPFFRLFRWWPSLTRR